ncbi:hypothetical protein RHSIM_Rhsim02G0154500 [Rhododendron simsii]|uniref:Reverse transcriptase/retrotransposon-derived protein RNase H-like domain-containing protein n=1 Tax=Rhododendron simsii TaxID=118357 RepID=A0A834HDV6_RHOSS|nr:hypothetical protein RHSIM_Rhsim02G0154500 [Rhododendron simsii]
MQQCFQEHQILFNKPPVLTAPIPGRPLILYIAAQEHLVGALLAQENDEGKENALYYLSKMMLRHELNYSVIEKMYLALVFAIQKMQHYFQAHTVHLISKANPIKYVMPKLVLSDRLASGAGAGVVFISPKGDVLPYAFTFTQNCPNNEAEYQALILGLEMAVKAKHLQHKGYSSVALEKMRQSKLWKKLILEYAKFGFKQHASTMYNPPANGLAEAFNRTLGSLLKKVVAKARRDWPERME